MNPSLPSSSEIIALLKSADAESFPALERSLAADTRKTVIKALETARKRLAQEAQEAQRVARLYDYQRELSAGGVCVGLDEVGRGPLAGPLTVGAVVLPADPHILGLNDSKQVPAAKREELSQLIRSCALAWSIQHIPPDEIDACGMTASLRVAFSRAVRAIENAGVHIDVVLLDGNPLHFDEREVNVVKGDARCASIAAASLIAKVERDALMVEASKRYPAYGFDSNKGYGSTQHQQAIRDHGLCPLHRVSFCGNFTQDSLF